MMLNCKGPKFDFWGENSKNPVQKSRENGKYLQYPYLLIYWYKFCTVVVHILNKDIICDTKLKKSKNKPFWGKIFKFCD